MVKNAKRMREKRVLISTFKELKTVSQESCILLPEDSDLFLKDVTKMIVYDGYFNSCTTKEEFAEELRSLASILRKDYTKAPAI